MRQRQLGSKVDLHLHQQLLESLGDEDQREMARLMSDDGMTYDGMYWHYIDKWEGRAAEFRDGYGRGPR